MIFLKVYFSVPNINLTVIQMKGKDCTWMHLNKSSNLLISVKHKQIEFQQHEIFHYRSSYNVLNKEGLWYFCFWYQQENGKLHGNNNSSFYHLRHRNCSRIIECSITNVRYRKKRPGWFLWWFDLLYHSYHPCFHCKSRDIL